MIAPLKKPSELRRMFGENLCSLAKGYPSISELSRRLGINRTQFNRYLSGENFPRPDVLARICSFLKSTPAFYWNQSIAYVRLQTPFPVISSATLWELEHATYPKTYSQTDFIAFPAAAFLMLTNLYAGWYLSKGTKAVPLFVVTSQGKQWMHKV